MEETKKSASTENNTNTTPATATQTQTATQETNTAVNSSTSPSSTEPTKPAETKPAESTPAEPKEEFNLKPEDYGNFGLDEKTSKIEEDLSKQLKDFGIEHKISKESMNKFVKGYVDFANKKLEKHNNEYKALQSSWEKKNQDTFGNDVNKVYGNIDTFLEGTEKGKAFNKFLKDNGVSKNNIVVEFLNEITKDYKEANLIKSNSSGVVEKSAYEILYPKEKYGR